MNQTIAANFNNKASDKNKDDSKKMEKLNTFSSIVMSLICLVVLLYLCGQFYCMKDTSLGADKERAT